MPTPRPPIPKHHQRHHDEAARFADRHFTDPDVALADAAVWVDVNERTLRDSLQQCGTSWKVMLLERRLERGRELLASTSYLIEFVARLSGYRSKSAFAKAFEKRFRTTPSGYRASQRKPRRSGVPTGAARRARGAPHPVGEWGPVVWNPTEGERAVILKEVDEAIERLSDRALFEEFFPRSDFDLEEVQNERISPRRLRDDPAHWRERHQHLQAWIDENDRPLPQGERRQWSPEDFEVIRPPRDVAN